MNASVLTFQIAGEETVEAAREFQRSVYARDLRHVPIDTPDPAARHFIAIAAGRIVASFRLLGPEARPFDLEESVDLAQILGAKARPALLGRLCVHPNYRQVDRSLAVNTGLMALLIQYAAEHGITDFILYTYDDLRNFYRAGGFRDTGVTFHHNDWGTIRLMHRPIHLGAT